MANIWEHPTIIAAEALTHLEDALVITGMCTKDETSEFNTRANGWKKGDTIPFRTHGDYVAKEFVSTIEVQPISTSTRSMVIEKHLDISVEVTAREEAMELDSFSDQVIKPAAYRLAEFVDTYVGTKILQAAGMYYSSDLFANAADVALARKYATLQQLSMNRFSLCNLSLEAKMLGQTWFNQSQTRGAPGVSSLQSGIMGHVMGMDWFSSVAFPVQAYTCGTMVCAVNNGAGGNTNNKIGDENLIVDTQTASKVLYAGDRLIVAGLRRPLIVKTAIPDTSATTTVALVDPITEIVPDNAAVVVLGSGLTIDVLGAIFDDRSLAVAFPILDAPQDRVTATASNNGVSIRVVKGYDLSTKKTTLSMDLLCGAFAFDPRRITLLGDATT